MLSLNSPENSEVFSNPASTFKAITSSGLRIKRQF